MRRFPRGEQNCEIAGVDDAITCEIGEQWNGRRDERDFEARTKDRVDVLTRANCDPIIVARAANSSRRS